MSALKLKKHFSRFLDAAPERLHFAAHSHHFWPDVSFTAQQKCWEDAARLVDKKWDHVFSKLIPRLQSRIAGILSLPEPRNIAFAPNTHEFVVRLLSCLNPDRPPAILTTGSEFHSFNRQVTRLEEEGLAYVTRVPTQPFETFAERFASEAAKGGHDMVYFSHVFYDSGYVVPDLPSIVRAVPDDATLVVIDGYHGFMALPTDLSAIADRAFYTAGGYKYAMAGEGCAFMHCPPNYGVAPRNTGWFAGFGDLAQSVGGVGYAGDGSRFWGATFDPAGMYRMNAVLGWLEQLKISVADLHNHAHRLQEKFAGRLVEFGHPELGAERLVVGTDIAHRGNFLTFETRQADELQAKLMDAGIITDNRGTRLRFGFGAYQDEGDLDQLFAKVPHILKEPV